MMTPSCTPLTGRTWHIIATPLPMLLGIGFGCGLLTTATVAAAIRSVPAAKSGLASGVNNTMRQTGTALGIACFGALVGTPDHATAFNAAWHALAWIALALWTAAFALALLATSRPAGRAHQHA